MKRTLALCAIGLACATPQAFAEGYDDTGAFYLAPMADYALLDHRRISKDDIGYQVSLGYNIPTNFALELALAPNSYSIRGSGAHEKLFATSLDMLYKLLPPRYWVRPYALVGVG